MKQSSSATIALLAMILAVALAGCGKKNFPTPPGPPNQVIYPRTYPQYDPAY
jgi:hypothetical protein